MSALMSLLQALLEYAPPLMFAALGGVLSEKSGVVNIGLEGMMRFGAFFAAAVAIWTGNPWLGAVAGMVAGAAVASVHALLCLRFRADQVVSGVALNLVALGLITFLLEISFASAGVSPPAPQLPRSLGGHTALTWLALALPFGMHWFFTRTATGLRVRAIGENPKAAATLGVRVLRLRALCVLGSGGLAGLGGACLSIGILGQFDARMPAGQGFMALAAMVFGKWTPLGAAGAALFFAGADALQRQLSFSLHAADLRLEGVFLALPYVLTLLVLALGVGRTRAPAADGIPYAPEER
ncbi:MAG: ABC transporter permease [Deltaproteobacteria bacterium]|nr:ABC transporter permease [Deltaproteobacteria bacterium]